MLITIFSQISTSLPISRTEQNMWLNTEHTFEAVNDMENDMLLMWLNHVILKLQYHKMNDNERLVNGNRMQNMKMTWENDG